jgi:antibiotic biosynthesis monooxygenase (ABM) superfamily enzyme
MTDHDLPAPTAAPQPVLWKMWLLMVCGIYPIITLLAGVAEPLLRHLPMPLRFAIVVPVMVAVMVWFVLPQLHRRFGAWLTR